jgi:hypothetical protein
LRVYTAILLLFLWCEQRILLFEDIVVFALIGPVWLCVFVGLAEGFCFFFPLFPLDRYAWVCFDVLCFVLGLLGVSFMAKSQVVFLVYFFLLSY